MNDFVEKLLDFPDTKVLSCDIKQHIIYITVESTTDKIPCQRCGKPARSKGVGQTVQLRHLPILGHECYIVIKPKRGICDHCDDHPTTNQRLDWYEYKSRYTNTYENHILLSLVNSTVTDVAIKEGVGYDAVDGILSRRISQTINWSELDVIDLLGIDEISLRKGYKDYLTIVTSHHNHKTTILSVIKGREKHTIAAFLSTIPKILQRTLNGVCCDLHEGYINAAKETFNKATPVIADRFHVAKLYRRCLISLRKSELARLRQTLSKEDYASLKSAIAILKRNKEYITNEEKKILKRLFDYSPSLKAAYKQCCRLTGIFNSQIGKRKANRKLNKWISQVESNQLNCFNTFIKTLKNHQKEIVAYFKGRYTSGFVEGFNNKVKVLKRRCYGILNENSLFRRLFLDCQGYGLFLKNRGFSTI
jgi:transposase